MNIMYKENITISSRNKNYQNAKRVFISIAILLISLSISAQSAIQAKKILDKTASIVGRKDGASANFTISSGKYGSTSGHVAIKGNKFYAYTPEAKVWFDGKTQWSYMKKTNEVNVSVPTEAQQVSMNPYKFITMYKNGYTLGMTNKNGNYVIHLTAQNKKRSVQEMYITINRNYYPEQVKMRQGKTWTTINISNFSAKNQNDATFRFPAKDYTNAEIIDLR